MRIMERKLNRRIHRLSSRKFLSFEVTLVVWIERQSENKDDSEAKGESETNDAAFYDDCAEW